MTTRYTNEEWAVRIRDVERDLVVPRVQHPYPPIGSPAFAKLIDHTLLKLDATPAQIDALCAEARSYGFKAVCVRPNYVSRAVSNLRGTDVVVASVIGFHEGTQPLTDKTREVQIATSAGATELDMVLNHAELSAGNYEPVFREIAALRSLAPSPVVLKVILETSQLTPSAIVAACVLAADARADFVKTSTGFVGRGATVEDVRLMRAAAERADPRRVMSVKASGGVRSLRDMVTMLEAGASRIGTSAGIWIVKEAVEEEGKRGKVNVGGEDQAKLGITRLYSDEY